MEEQTEIRKKGGFIKVDKRYTITFYYAGVKQEATFNEVKGVLYDPTLTISYYKEKTPDVSACKTIDEALLVVQSISKGAKISHINGIPAFCYDKKNIHQLIHDFSHEYYDFQATRAKKYFLEALYPMLIANEWKLGRSGMTGQLVLVYKNEKGEWNNVNDTDKEFEFTYLCQIFLNSIGANGDESRWAVQQVLGLVEETVAELKLEIEDEK